MYLDLSSINLQDQSGEIGALTSLVELFLSENELSGNIPNEIGNLSYLSSFYVNEIRSLVNYHLN